MDVNTINDATVIKSNNVKDLLTEVSKETYTDLSELIGNNKPTTMKYSIDTCVSQKPDNHLCVTILKVHLSDGSWVAEDMFSYVFRSTTVSIKNMEQAIKDMVNYYKKNILKLED